MTPDLTDDDKATLADLLRETIERDRFPLSPRVRSFKAILAKRDPPAPRSEPIPPPKPPGERSVCYRGSGGGRGRDGRLSGLAEGSRVAVDVADGRKGPAAVSLWPDLTPFGGR
jgi:hypothetical protein